MAQGKNALVTGSARGIGKYIALRLGRDGFNVVINDTEAMRAEGEATAKEVSANGVKSIFIAADVSSEADVQRLIQETVAAFGSLNVSIANAGIAQVKSILNTSADDWDRMFSINARGVFNTYKASAQQMIEQKTGGKIIGAASIVAFKPFAMMSPYSASKWAVRGLTQAAAQEFADYKITVNAYAPGIVGTKMWDLIDSEYAKLEGRSELKPGEYMAIQVEKLTAMKRVSTEDDVAKVVSFLSGPDSDFMTGQTVIVDGGIEFS